MSALGQFSQGPIQFGSNGAIEPRGTIDQPSPSATDAPASPAIPNPAGAPDGGGVLPPDSFGSATDSSNTSPPGDSASIMSEPDTLADTPDNHGSDFGPSSFGGRATIGSHTDIGSFNNAMGADFSQNINAMGVPRYQIGFDDGGEVDPSNESDGTEGQGAGAATVDPMGMIKQAASFGRKKFGLPVNFSTGQNEQDGQSQTMGFDDGGMIPDDTEGQDAGNDQGDDVTGGGNTPDPRKALAYLTGDGAVSPEIAGALERHVDQAGQMDPAERTMAAINAAPSDEAKFGMMQHYRTRYNAFAGGAKAALDQGNLGQAAAHATQAFANVPTGQKVKFAPAQGGIAVMAAPVQGIRQFMGSGPLGKAPVRAADDAWEKYHGDGAQSLADGGEVEDDEGDTDSGLPAGVLPDPDGAAAADADQPEATPEQDTGSAQPTVLTPDQFKKLLSAGYDKPVDDGWEGLMKSVMDMVGPSQAEAGTLPQPGQPHPADAGGTTTVGKSDRQPISPALQSQMSKPTPLAQVAERQQAAKPTEDREAKYQAVLERAQKTAAQIFPWASQEAQRSQYVQQQMSHYGDSENKIDQIGASGREGAAVTREQGRMAVETMREAGRNQRQANSAHSREDIARMNNAYRSFNGAQREQVRLLGQQLAADPSLARDPNKAMARVQQISAQLNINPQDLMAIVKNGGSPPQQPSQSAPAPSQGGGAAPKPTVVVFPSGPYAGKPMIRQPDGTYVLAPH